MDRYSRRQAVRNGTRHKRPFNFLWLPIAVPLAAGTVTYYVSTQPVSLPRVNALGGQTADCDIKGNISITGERIFHVPGQEYYSETFINTAKGERWFCSQWDAWWAGWRKAKV